MAPLLFSARLLMLIAFNGYAQAQSESAAISSISSAAKTVSSVATSVNTLTSSPMSTGVLSAPATSATSATTTTTLPSIVPSSQGYKYIGCYNESVWDDAAGNVRALSERGNMTASDSMTVDSCMTFCKSANAQYGGLEYGRECWCAISLNVNAVLLPDSNCTFPCAGNKAAVCGGSWKLTVYQANATNAAGKVEIGWGVIIATILALGIALMIMT